MVKLTNKHGTVATLIQSCADELAHAGVFYGHGTDCDLDEAAALVYFATGLEHSGDEQSALEVPVSAQAVSRATELLRRRIDSRVPLAYLTQEAWFAGLKFFVDERVLIPRSPFAELIEAQFQPWLGPQQPATILEIGTGSGCIAIATALAFPGSRVMATDISPAALEVARINVARHGLESRMTLLQADLFDGIDERFDLILSNPPYVPAREVPGLPDEYGHEPELALVSGGDGLDSARRILQDAAGHLTAGGLLALEVGHVWPDLEASFPTLPFVWPAFERGGEGIGLLTAADLEATIRV
jgi:ribosomal protein L3 glutamine methyltransferase